MLLFSAHADDYSDISQLIRAGKLPEATAKTDQLLAAKPKDPQLRFLKGVIQRDSGRTMDAIATFSRLSEDYPELPEPYNNLAVLYAGQNQFDKARAALEMAIRTNPSYATAHENLGDVYAKLASQAYNKALQLDATSPAVPPKLALIRELFSQPSAKAQRPAQTNIAPTPAVAALAVAPPAAHTPTSTPVAIKAPAPAPTPAATTPPPAPVSVATPAVATISAPTVAANPSKEAEAAVRAWASAWAAKDIKAYLSAYGKEFDPPGKMNRGTWEQDRRLRISSKSKISVRLENLSISVNGNKAVAKFRQDYKADGLSITSRKTLDLVKSADRWQIIKESTGN